MIQFIRRLGNTTIGRSVRSLPVLGATAERVYDWSRDLKEQRHIEAYPDKCVLNIGEETYEFPPEPTPILEDYECIKYTFDRLHKEDVVYDIGANVGHHTIPYASKCNEVVSFEPLPSNVDRLVEALEFNKITNVTINQVAVTNEDGFVSLSAPQGCEKEVDPRARIVDVGNNNAITVEAWCLDNHTTDLPVPDKIKIDVEGAEYDVLIGSESLIRDSQPELFIEIHRQKLASFGASPDDVIEFLHQLGYYDPTRIRPDGPMRSWFHFTTPSAASSLNC